MLFAGASGNGRSTLLATLVARGYPMLADDVSGIVLDAEGRATVVPAFPSVRLRPDALQAVGLPGGRAEGAQDELGKRLLPVKRF